VERLLEALREIPVEQRRMLGLLTTLTGVVLLWVLRG
jgi:hypothetical protein